MRRLRARVPRRGGARAASPRARGAPPRRRCRRRLRPPRCARRGPRTEPRRRRRASRPRASRARQGRSCQEMAPTNKMDATRRAPLVTSRAAGKCRRKDTRAAARDAPAARHGRAGRRRRAEAARAQRRRRRRSGIGGQPGVRLRGAAGAREGGWVASVAARPRRRGRRGARGGSGTAGSGASRPVGLGEPLAARERARRARPALGVRDRTTASCAPYSGAAWSSGARARQAEPTSHMPCLTASGRLVTGVQGQPNARADHAPGVQAHAPPL